jgi:hypothetical protein
MLANAFKDMENLPAGTSPLKLATSLMGATAGIPGAERYVGQLFPLLLQQMQTQAALNPEGGGLPSGQMQPGETPAQQGAQQQQEPIKGQQALNIEAEGRKGFLSGYLPEEEINNQARAYAAQTNSGIEGYNLKRSQMLKQNENIEKQRAQVEQRFLEGGGKQDQVPFYMQLASRAKGRTAEEITRNTRPLFKKYENLTDSLENFSYPSIFAPKGREERLARLQGISKDLIKLGFEDKVRGTLTTKGLSPTEISETIHPMPKETTKELNSIPEASRLHGIQGIGNVQKANEFKDEKIKDFLAKNTNPNLSLLSVRHKLFEKGYDWQRVAGIMRNLYEGENAPQLTIEQIDELSTLQKEPPRDSLAYVFQDWSNIFNRMRGEK